MAKDIYVSTNGSDAWSGTKARPLATLTMARDITRQSKPGEKKRIIVMSGKYALHEPLMLDARDSDLTIEAASGGEAILYGGRRIVNWEKDGDRFYSASLPDVLENKWDFRQLYVNGEMRPRARLPEEGFFEHESVFDQRWLMTTGGGFQPPPTIEQRSTMVHAPGQLGPWLSIKNAEFVIYHSWDESRARAIAYDAGTRTLRLDPPCTYPPGAFSVKKYVVENVREGMKKPGQWYLDRDQGKVVYWPLSGEDPRNCEIEAPVLLTLVQVLGTAKGPARSITLKGLAFDTTGVIIGASGWGAPVFDGALSLKNVENCRLIGLSVRRAGGQGIKIINASDTVVKGCHVNDTGANGILFYGGARNRIASNEVYATGLIYPSAIGISAGNLTYSRISHNEVHNCTYSGIALGNGMDEERPACNVVEYNRVDNVMHGLDDGGCIYLFGRERFTRVIGNVLSRSSAQQRFTVGLYLDEHVRDVTCVGNVVTRAGNFVLHMNITQDCTIRNNLFVCGPGNTINIGEGCRFQRNIIYGPETGMQFRVASSARIADNLYFAGEKPVYPISVVWRGMRAFPNGFLAEVPRFDTIMVGAGHSGPTQTSADGSRSLGAATLIRTPPGDFPDEASWETALILPDMVGPSGKPDPGISTDSRILTDGRSLYLRVICMEAGAKADQSAKVIWQRDHIELFLKPNVRQEGVLQIGLARDGDLKVVNPLETREHQVSWAHRAEEVPKGWRAMLSVPLEDATALLNLEATPEWGILVGRADSRREEFGIKGTLADPKFIAPEKEDFRFQPDSPAIAMGIKPFDTQKAGIQRK